MNIVFRKIAAKTSIATKVAAKAALKAAGLKQALAAELLEEAQDLRSERALAKITRVARKAGVTVGNVRLFDRRPALFSGLRQGSLVERLAKVRRAAVSGTANRAIRMGTNDTLEIVLTADPAAIGMTQTECVDYDTYKGQYKGWACNYKASKITVPADWRVRVERRGLALVDGMMTLDAAPLEADGCEVFAATWLVQRRGNFADTVRGYIARANGITYHGTNSDEAISRLAKKRRELAFIARINAADLGALVDACANAVVTVADARKIGACEYGIRSWCASVGLDFAAGSAPLAQVYAAYQREPRPEARAAILRVLRTNRALAAV